MVDFQTDRFCNIMANEFKIWIFQIVSDVFLLSSVEVIQANNFMALSEEFVAKMRTEKAGAAGDEDPLAGRGPSARSTG